MSDYPMSSDGRPLGKDRSPWAVLGLILVTLTIYFYVWYYKVNREMRDHDERVEVRPGLAVVALVVPIVNLVSMFNTAKRLQQIQAMEGLETTSSPGLALILALFTGGIGYPAYMASLLRRHWQLHQEGASDAGYAPYGALAQGGPPGASYGLPASGQSGYAQLPEAYHAQSPGEQLSPDGRYRWDGQVWQPVQAQAQRAPELAQPAPQMQQAIPAPHEQLSPDGRYRWDGQAWQPVEEQPSAAQQMGGQEHSVSGDVQGQQTSGTSAGEQLSPDGRFRWDGRAWQPVRAQQIPATAPAPAEQLSPDGRFRWDGQAWQPVREAPQVAAVAPAASPAEQLSPDGRYRWDGQAWQPVEQQPHPGPAHPAAHPVAAVRDQPGGQLSPDGRYRWDGYSWQPVRD
ncbi:MAG: DUF4234 domain-containing protein [Candidatus Dormibacteria bacterium]